MTVAAGAAALRVGDVLLLPESEYLYGVGGFTARDLYVRHASLSRTRQVPRQ